MKRHLLTLAFLIPLLFTITTTSAQRTCSHTEHQHQLMQNPAYSADYIQRQARFQNKMAQTSNMERAQCANPVTLPMAVHFQGVSNPDQACLIALAEAQIQILNEDYGGYNADITNWTNNAAASFPGVSNGETCIAFCLATANHPSGYGLTEGQPAVTFNAFNGDFNGDFSGYINIFVRNISALGYSPLGGSGNGDGVVIDNNAFGSGAGCAGVAPGAPYNLGRTLTHELGHYLNLDHIWGGGCGSDDGIADTPDSQSSYGGCPNVGVASCNSTDMHMNYMDYTNDACMYMFSAGQSTVMENYVSANLSNVVNNYNTVCNVPDPTCTDGIQNGDETGVDCGGPDCPVCVPTCTDGVQNGNETGVDCGGPDCPTCPTCSDGIQNGDETGVDCGGSCPTSCPCTAFNGSALYSWDVGVPTACGVANATQTTYQAWTNEGFIIENMALDQAYNYNFCTGYDANTWEGSLTVYSLSGDATNGYAIEEFLGFIEGCSIDFTTSATYSTTLVYTNGVADDCDVASTQTDNGFYQLYCIDNSSNNDIYVDAAATGGGDDGTSWPDAYRDLQDALANGAGKTIHIAAGTYFPTSTTTRGIAFDIPDGATLLGGYPVGGGERDPSSNTTILSGDIDQDGAYNGNSYHVVRVLNVNNVVIDGLHIKDGNADSETSFGRSRGGGVFSNGATVEFNDVVFRRNKAIKGGAMFATLSPTVTLNNCEIKLNEAENGSALYHSNQTNMYINACMIRDNNSTTRCAIEVNNSLFTEINNTVIANNPSRNANAIGFIATNRDQTCNIYNTTILGENKDKYLLSLQVGNNDVLDLNIYNTIIAHQNTNFTKSVVAYNNGTLNFNTTHCYVQGSNIIGTTDGNLYEDASGALVFSTGYELDPCSPGVNAGNDADTNGLTVDHNGNTRIVGTVDIGAYEAQAACREIQEQLSADISVFPNPTEGKLTIQTQLETFNAYLYDMLGQQVLQTSTREMNISSLPTGIYMMHIESNGEIVKTEKIVKR